MYKIQVITETKYNMINPSKYLITPGNSIRSKASYATRKFVTILDKKGAILPVILLEGTVTGGRTYQAYKRDGFVEARERVTEESLGAIFWLFGASMFGKIFDKIGQKFLKIPKNMPDVGKDAARKPFDNYIKGVISRIPGITPEKVSKVEKNLAGYSVGKTFASLLMACLFIGYVVPKLNQSITKYLYGKMDAKDPNHEKAPNPYTTRLTIKDARNIYSAKDVSINAVDNFKARNSQGQLQKIDYTKKNIPSFKAGADSLLRIVQNFEENAIWKLMGTDVGTVSGRALNARNKDERIEIMFRDISSIYFYCFSMPAIVSFMNRKDSFGGKNTKLNPMSAMEVHNSLIKKMSEIKTGNGSIGVDSMTPEQFKKFTLGKELNETELKLIDELFPNKKDASVKKVFFGLFNKKEKEVYDIAKLEDFEKYIDKYITNPSEAEVLKKRAREMSKLQPLKDGYGILTNKQAEDVIKGGFVREPEFMKDILNRIFEDKLIDVNNPKSLKKAKYPLSNSFKYIPMEDIEDRRKRIIGYVESIVEDARNNKTNVTWDSMLKMNKRNMRKNGIFMGLAMGVSALFLSTIIPKIQYYITYKRTGKNSFPGTENMQSK